MNKTYIYYIIASSLISLARSQFRSLVTPNSLLGLSAVVKHGVPQFCHIIQFSQTFGIGQLDCDAGHVLKII